MVARRARRPARVGQVAPSEDDYRARHPGGASARWCAQLQARLQCDTNPSTHLPLVRPPTSRRATRPTCPGGARRIRRRCARGRPTAPCAGRAGTVTAAERRPSSAWRETGRGAPRRVVTRTAGSWKRDGARHPVPSFGAPHGRDRVFVVAHADRQGEPLRALHEEVARIRPVSGAVRDGRPSPPGGFRVDDGTTSGMDRCRVVGEGVDVRVARWLGERIRELA